MKKPNPKCKKFELRLAPFSCSTAAPKKYIPFWRNESSASLAYTLFRRRFVFLSRRSLPYLFLASAARSENQTDSNAEKMITPRTSDHVPCYSWGVCGTRGWALNMSSWWSKALISLNHLTQVNGSSTLYTSSASVDFVPGFGITNTTRS